MVPGPRQAPPLAIPDCPILPTALRNRLVQLETQLTDPALTSVHAIVLTAGIDGEVSVLGNQDYLEVWNRKAIKEQVRPFSDDERKELTSLGF